MRVSALFAVPLALVFSSLVQAQQVTHPAAQDQSPSSVGSTLATPQLTPRQTAELRGDVLMARKEFAQAAAAYELITADEPKNSLVLNKIGVAYQELGDLNRSTRFYKKAMKADKNFASPINNLGTIEYEKKHYGRAISLYKHASTLKIDLSTIFSNLGYAYFANKEYPQAMDTFAKALELDPTIFDHKGGAGSIIQQRTTTDPGLFSFFVAKQYASMGDAERSAHYLKVARDDGYPNFLSAQTDPAFAKVIKDPRVQEVLQAPPPFLDHAKKTSPN
jgi:tetratricopeptide (TPR) repeat protein